MNKHIDTRPYSGWEQPEPEQAFIDKHADDLEDWRQIRSQVAEIAIANGWTKAEVSRVGGGSLLIVDEAQNLVDDAINQLRHFSDIHQCGIALVGNEEVYSRFVAQVKGRSYAQLKRRIGKHLKRQKPYAEDIAAFIRAWGVTDPECTRLLTGIGLKGGALGQIDKTMKLASMIALGDNREVGIRDIEAAWKNRDVEDMA